MDGELAVEHGASPQPLHAHRHMVSACGAIEARVKAPSFLVKHDGPRGSARKMQRLRCTAKAAKRFADLFELHAPSELYRDELRLTGMGLSG